MAINSETVSSSDSALQISKDITESFISKFGDIQKLADNNRHNFPELVSQVADHMVREVEERNIKKREDLGDILGGFVSNVIKEGWSELQVAPLGSFEKDPVNLSDNVLKKKVEQHISSRSNGLENGTYCR